MRRKYLIFILFVIIIFNKGCFYDEKEKNIVIKNISNEEDNEEIEYDAKAIFKLESSAFGFYDSMIAWKDDNRVFRKIYNEETNENKIYSTDYKYGFSDEIMTYNSFDRNIIGFSKEGKNIYYQNNGDITDVYKYDIENNKPILIDEYDSYSNYKVYNFNDSTYYYGVLFYNYSDDTVLYEIHNANNYSIVNTFYIGKINRNENINYVTFKKDGKEILVSLFDDEKKVNILKIIKEDNSTVILDGINKLLSKEEFSSYYEEVGIVRNILNIQYEDYILGNSMYIFRVNNLWDNASIQPLYVDKKGGEKIISNNYIYNNDSNLFAYTKKKEGDTYDIYIGELQGNVIKNTKLIYKDISQNIISLSFSEDGSSLLVEYLSTKESPYYNNGGEIINEGLVIDLK